MTPLPARALKALGAAVRDQQPDAQAPPAAGPWFVAAGIVIALAAVITAPLHQYTFSPAHPFAVLVVLATVAVLSVLLPLSSVGGTLADYSALAATTATIMLGLPTGLAIAVVSMLWSDLRYLTSVGGWRNSVVNITNVVASRSLCWWPATMVWHATHSPPLTILALEFLLLLLNLGQVVTYLRHVGLEVRSLIHGQIETLPMTVATTVLMIVAVAAGTVEPILLSVLLIPMLFIRIFDISRAQLIHGERRLVVDPLTGVYNRMLFWQRIEQDMDALHEAEPGAPLLGVIMIDVDHFKQLNDVYGHLAGDDALVRAADALHRAAAGAIVARYGGEEFGIVTRVTDGDHLLRVATRAHRAACEALLEWSTSVSVGVAVFRPELHTVARDLVSEADAALYRAKRAGRDRIEAGPSLPLEPEDDLAVAA